MKETDIALAAPAHSALAEYPGPGAITVAQPAIVKQPAGEFDKELFESSRLTVNLIKVVL